MDNRQTSIKDMLVLLYLLETKTVVRSNREMTAADLNGYRYLLNKIINAQFLISLSQLLNFFFIS